MGESNRQVSCVELINATFAPTPYPIPSASGWSSRRRGRIQRYPLPDPVMPAFVKVRAFGSPA
jgi:hypothetical protein